MMTAATRAVIAIDELSLRLPEVRFIEYDYRRNRARCEFAAELFVERGPSPLRNDQNRDVASVDDRPRRAHARFAEVAFIVDSRGVYEDHGTERKHLHRLLHGVGRGPGMGRYDGHALARDGVDERRLAGIAGPEDTHLQP